MEQIGRYRVLRPLAVGGMGQVFLAEDPELERQVALKLLHRDPNRGLRREAKTLAALSHPNIVTIFEIGEHEGHDFIAMEYLPGKTLRDILNGERPTREELLAILSSVAVAVHAAHKAGILHRDIKPENVVTTPNGVKVVDFGIARRLEERASNVSSPNDLYEVLITPGPKKPTTIPAGDTLPTTEDTVLSAVASAGTQTVFGTPAYMAPEVLGGDPSSEASDVYSLGVMLYECLAGKRPYDAGNLIETIAHIIQAPAPTLADPLNPLITRMLARDPEARPPLVEVIARLQPVAETPARRSNRWLIVGGVIAAAAVAGGIAFAVRGDRDSLPAEEQTTPLRKIRVGIAPVPVDMPTWGVYRSDPRATAQTMARALRKAKNVELDVRPVIGKDLQAQLVEATNIPVEYLAVFSIVEAADRPELLGKTTIFDVKTGKQIGESQTDKLPSMQLRRVQYEMLDAALKLIAPDAGALPREHDVRVAQEELASGNAAVASGDFDKARVHFAASVTFDPSLADAWYGLALALGWTEATEDLTLQAIDNAEQLAAPGRRKQLMHAVGLFSRDHFSQARVELEKLATESDDGPDQLELLYFLGDSNWHDGRHDAAYKYFMRAYNIPPRSRAMAIHPAQYLIARRQGDEARYLAGAAGLSDTNQIEFSLRSYKKLAAGENTAYRIMSRIVLGEKVPRAELHAQYSRVPLDWLSVEVALAIEDGDRGKASQIFDRGFADLLDGKQLGAAEFFFIEYLGEVVVAAGLGDEARRIVKLLADHSGQRPRRGYHRLAMLAAALTRDLSLIPTGPTVSERNRTLAEAARAEIAGDPQKAAKLLTEIVKNPTYTWDYPERATLIRNLRAINDEAAVEALCKDTLAPAIYRHAFMVVRSLCRKP